MQATYPGNLRHHAGLADIPDSWSKAYTHRKRKTLVARLALWGAVIGFALLVLAVAGQVFG